METVKTGIVGVGNIGTAHLHSIGEGHIEGMELCAACDISESRLEYCRSRFPQVRVFRDWREMLDSGLADAVIVSVPHPLHAAIAGYALERGIHTLVEKPEDSRISAAERLNGIASSSDRVFGIMFNQRTNSLFSRARELVRNGSLGELKRSVWIITNWYRTQDYYDSGSWRATWSGEGGGVLLNQAPHNLDLWQWICGMPVEVTAFCDVGKYHNIEVEDDVTIFARYGNGATGVFITTTGEFPGTNRLEISGDRGRIVIENGTLKFWELRESERTFCFREKKDGEELAYSYSEFGCAEESGHRGILCNFSSAIRFGTPLLAPGTEGINELEISCAAYMSSWLGTPVRLPVDAKKYDELLDGKITSAKRVVKERTGDRHGGYLPRWKVNW